VQKNELIYFREILENRKKQINRNIDGVNDELSQLSGLELNDEGDHAAANNNSMVESAIIIQQTQELREIEVTLGKIMHGDYGTCEMCEDDIGIERLKVKSHAIYCIDCREIIEKTRQ